MFTISRLHVMKRSAGYRRCRASDDTRARAAPSKKERDRRSSTTSVPLRPGLLKIRLGSITMRPPPAFLDDFVSTYLHSPLSRALLTYWNYEYKFKPSTSEIAIDSIPMYLRTAFGSAKQGGRRFHVRLGTLCVEIPFSLHRGDFGEDEHVEQKPREKIVVRIENVICRNNLSSTKDELGSSSSTRSTTSSNPALRTRIFAATIPLAVRTYVRSLRRRVAGGDTAIWPSQLSVNVGLASASIVTPNGDVLASVGAHGTHIVTSVDGKWRISESAGQWPSGLPAILAGCVDVERASIRCDPAISVNNLKDRALNLLDAFWESYSWRLPNDEKDPKIDDGPSNVVDAIDTMPQTSTRASFRRALSGLMRIDSSSPKSSTGRNGSRRWLWALLVRLGVIEFHAPFLPLDSVLRFRTSGPFEISAHCFRGQIVTSSSSSSSADAIQTPLRSHAESKEHDDADDEIWDDISRSSRAARTSASKNLPAAILRPLRRLIPAKSRKGSSAVVDDGDRDRKSVV